MRWMDKKEGGRGVIYQELWGAEYVQSERLDPGVVDPQLPVDPRTFNAGEDAQVGGEPRRVWGKEEESQDQTGEEVMRTQEGESDENGWCTVPEHWSKCNSCSMWANFNVSLRKVLEMEWLLEGFYTTSLPEDSDQEL